MLIAHLETKAFNEAGNMSDSCEIKFYDVSEQFPDSLHQSTDQMMQYALVYDACSFTVTRLGLHVLFLAS